MQGTDSMSYNATLKSPRVAEEERELEFWKISSHSHLTAEFLNS